MAEQTNERQKMSRMEKVAGALPKIVSIGGAATMIGGLIGMHYTGGIIETYILGGRADFGISTLGTVSVFATLLGFTFSGFYYLFEEDKPRQNKEEHITDYQI